MPRFKLLLVMAVLAAGIAGAWRFRKQPNVVEPVPEGLTFHDPIERRISGPSGSGFRPGVFQPAPNQAPVYKVPTASTGGLAERPAAPPDLPASYERTVSPLGGLLVASGHTPEAASRPLLEPDDTEGARLEQPILSEPEVRTHRIADGDTLSRLAERYLGSSDRYLELYEANRDVISSPDVLPIGAELKIPLRAARASAAQPADDVPRLVPVPKSAGR